MTKERLLLEEIDKYSSRHGEILPANLADALQEVLSQPEQTKQEPIDTRRITLDMFSKNININYKDGYVAGIRFAEKEHGIGGDDE